MTMRTAFIVSLLIALLVSGCATKPQITTVIEPVDLGDVTKVDKISGVATVSKSGVSISIKPLDTSDLLRLSDGDPDINPFVRSGSWGKVYPMYTVFEVVIRNETRNKVSVDPVAVLMTEDGEQYGSLPYEYFRDILGNSYERQVVVYVPVRYRLWYDPLWHGRYYRPYWHPLPSRAFYGRYYTRIVSYSDRALMRQVARDSMLARTNVVPGGKRSGLIVFEMLPDDVSQFKVIIPEVRIYRAGDERPRRFDFEFHFNQRLLRK